MWQVSHLSQQAAESQAQQDRLLRDKGSLTKQLEDALNKLTNQEQDNTKVQCPLCAHAMYWPSLTFFFLFALLTFAIVI